MHILFSKQDLYNAVGIVSKAVPSRTTMDILSCIILRAEGGEIHLMASDTDFGIDTMIPGQILEEGCIGIPARFMTEMVRKIPDEEVVLQCEESSGITTIRAGGATLSTFAKDASEFSFFEIPSQEEPFVISQMALRDAIRATFFSVADNDGNRMMTGENLEIREDQLKLTALDGHRIAIRTIALRERYEEMSAILPGKALSEIAKIVNGGAEDPVYVTLTKNEGVFSFDDTVIFTRLIEGDYFATDQLVQVDYETKMVVNRQEFATAIDLTTLMIKEGEKKPIVLDIGDNEVNIAIRSSQGTTDQTLSVYIEGKPLRIGFNPKYIMDVLKTVEDEEVSLYFINSQSPCIIRDQDNSYLYLILPVHVGAE